MNDYEQTIVTHAIRILTRQMPKDGVTTGKFSLSNDTSTRRFHLTIKDVTNEEPTYAKAQA